MKLKIEHTISLNSETFTSCERFRACYINWVRYTTKRCESRYATKEEWDAWLADSMARETIEEVFYVWSDSRLSVLFQDESGAIRCNAFGNSLDVTDEDRNMRANPTKTWIEFFRQSTLAV